MLKLLLNIYLLASIGVVQGCKGSQPKENTVKSQVDSTVFGYNIQEAKQYALPAELNEISGMVWLNGTENSIYAVQDEEGLLYTYDMSLGRITDRFQFGKKGDYEEVTSNGKLFFVLKSNGSIYTFPIDAKDITLVKEHSDVIPKGEYESMSFDTVTNKLYVLCKSCKEDKKNGSVTGYVLSLSQQEDNLVLEDTFSIAVDAMQRLDGSIAKSLKPSAMSKHPQYAEWYILSSVDKAILITDEHFVPKKIIRFERKEFEQPEGIGFDKHSNLFISSEIGDRKEAILYQFGPR